MGREIRRVPADWEHPKDGKGAFIPLYEKDYDTACREWMDNAILWDRGEHPDQQKIEGVGKYRFYWDWDGGPPDRESYRERTWTPEEATHYQVYETVSEGTPVTPHFATKAELIDYLVEHGDFWDQKDSFGNRRPQPGWSRANAEAFVEREWAPSFMVVNSDSGSVVFSPKDGVPT